MSVTVTLSNVLYKVGNPCVSGCNCIQEALAD